MIRLLMARLTLLFYGILAGFSLVLYRFLIGDWPSLFGPENFAVIFTGSLAVGVGTAFCSMVMSRRWEWAARLEKSFKVVIGDLKLHQIAAITFASAVGEEIMFRGTLQPYLGEFMGTEWGGYICASLFFGVLHVPIHRSLLPWTAFAIVMGFVMGGLFYWTGNILHPIAVHLAVNGINLYRINKLTLTEKEILGFWEMLGSGEDGGPQQFRPEDDTNRATQEATSENDESVVVGEPPTPEEPEDKQANHGLQNEESS